MHIPSCLPSGARQIQTLGSCLCIAWTFLTQPELRAESADTPGCVLGMLVQYMEKNNKVMVGDDFVNLI